MESHYSFTTYEASESWLSVNVHFAGVANETAAAGEHLQANDGGSGEVRSLEQG